MMYLSLFLLLLIKITVIKGLTCDDVLELPAENKLTLDNLKSMTPKDLTQCLAHLSKEQLPAAEADFIWQKIILYHDGIMNIPDKVLMLLHWITPAIPAEDYANITLNSIDVIQNFGLNYNLNADQLSAIADRIREDFAGKDPEDYTYYDLTALRQILCAFNRSEIERINPKAYKEAALIIGKLENCSSEVMLGFATLAVQNKAFGKPEMWTEGTLTVIGKVANYLPKEIIGQIRTDSTQN